MPKYKHPTINGAAPHVPDDPTPRQDESVPPDPPKPHRQAPPEVIPIPTLAERLNNRRGQPVPMLQPWRCTACEAHGNLECQSNDGCTYTWQEILQLHAAQSPDCHEQTGSRYIRVSNWFRQRKHEE
jgi:hypothetical protein